MKTLKTGDKLYLVNYKGILLDFTVTGEDRAGYLVHNPINGLTVPYPHPDEVFSRTKASAWVRYAKSFEGRVLEVKLQLSKAKARVSNFKKEFSLARKALSKARRGLARHLRHQT